MGLFLLCQQTKNNIFNELGWGNRIATWLFYVSYYFAARSIHFYQKNVSPLTDE